MKSDPALAKALLLLHKDWLAAHGVVTRFLVAVSQSKAFWQEYSFCGEASGVSAYDRKAVAVLSWTRTCCLPQRCGVPESLLYDVLIPIVGCVRSTGVGVRVPRIAFQ